MSGMAIMLRTGSENELPVGDGLVTDLSRGSPKRLRVTASDSAVYARQRPGTSLVSTALSGRYTVGMRCGTRGTTVPAACPTGRPH
jgi:hypothetical protein